MEIGFDRLAEVQEQILWLCEAAHVPVVWATQVREVLHNDDRCQRMVDRNYEVAHRFFSYRRTSDELLPILSKPRLCPTTD